jgi:ribonuclease P protein component
VPKEHSFNKSEHLCSDIVIAKLFEQGESFIAYPVRVIWVMEDTTGLSEVKVMVSVSKKKLKHAVDRNLAKRLVRESYRLNKLHLLNAAANNQKSLSICFIWIPDKTLTFSKTEHKIKLALAKIASAITPIENVNAGKQE